MPTDEEILIYSCVGGGVGLIALVLVVVCVCKRRGRLCGGLAEEGETGSSRRVSYGAGRHGASPNHQNALLGGRAHGDVDDEDASEQARRKRSEFTNASSGTQGGGDLADYLQNLVDGMRAERDRGGLRERPPTLARPASAAVLAAAGAAAAPAAGGGSSPFHLSRTAGGGGAGGDETSLLTMIPSNRSGVYAGTPSGGAASPFGASMSTGAHQPASLYPPQANKSQLLMGFDPLMPGPVAAAADTDESGGVVLSEEKVKSIERWREQVLLECSKWNASGGALDDPTCLMVSSFGGLQSDDSMHPL